MLGLLHSVPLLLGLLHARVGASRAAVTRRPSPAASPAAYFGAYEGLKVAFAEWQGVPVSQLGPASLMTAGGLGGFAFWAAVYPVDVSERGRAGADLAAPVDVPSFGC